MDKYFVHYDSRSNLISDYRSGSIRHYTCPTDMLETRLQGLFRRNQVLFFPDLETCWLNPQSHQSLFDLQGYKREDLPGYEEAEQSAQQWLKKQTAYRDTHQGTRFYTTQETPALRAKWLEYLDETPYALYEEPGQSIITDACLTQDEALFLEIARVIQNRHRRNALDLLDVQTAICWTKCLLWLMTDSVARTFIRMHIRFEKPADSSVKFAGYTKMRQGMGLSPCRNSPLRISGKGKILGLEKILAKLSNVKR